MKAAKTPNESLSTNVGERIKLASSFLLFSVFVVCMIDLTILTAGVANIPLWIYLSAIFTGVGLQVIGNVITNVRLGQSKLRPTKPIKH